MTSQAEYKHVRSWLKHKRDVEGVDIGVELNGYWQDMKAAYKRLINTDTATKSNTTTVSCDPNESDIPTDGNDEADIPTDGSAISFSPVSLIEVVSHEDVVINIDGEYRQVKVNWDDESDTGTTRFREVSVVSQAGIEPSVACCKLEIVPDEHGHYQVFPLCRFGGKVEWLYPDNNTKYVKIKAYLNSNEWRYVYVDLEHQTRDTVYSQNPVICTEMNDQKPGQRLRHATHAAFKLVGKTWMYDGFTEGRKWLDTIQSVTYPLFPPATLCFHQIDQNENSRAIWRVEKQQNTHGCCYAHLTCVVPANRYPKGMQITVPVVELQQIRQVK